MTLLLYNCTNENEVIAMVNGESISLEEYKLAYIEVLKQPDKFDSIELREAFLNELIHRKILAKEARDKNYAEDEKHKYRVDAFHNKCLRDAHFESVIKPKIKTDDKLLREVYKYSQEERKVQHLFFADKVDADKAFELLNKDVPFDEIATKLFSDSVMAKTKGSLGWVHWDQMEFDMAMAAFRLNLNEFSKPVKSTYGYHILKINDFKKKPLLTEHDYQTQLLNTQKMIETRLGEKLAFDAIGQIMQDVDIKMNPKMVRFVGEILNKVLQREPSTTDQMQLVQLDLEEQKSLEDMTWELRNDPMIYLDDVTISVGEFISNLSFIPYNEIKRSYKTVLNYAVRDAKLTMEAKALGLAESSNKVKLRTQIYDDYLLQFKRQAEIIRNVDTNESEIKDYYSALVKGKKLPDETFEQNYSVIKKQLLKIKKSKAISSYLNDMKTRIEIEKNNKPIHEYYNKYKFGKVAGKN